MKRFLPEPERTILGRYIGQCTQRIEAVRLESATEEVVKDIVRKQMRLLAEFIVFGPDENEE